MSYKNSDGVTVMKDSVNHSYSIACSHCETVSTHTCFEDSYTDNIRYGHLFEIVRVKSDSVYVAGCFYCGLRDISPFIGDCIESLEQHADFHDYAADSLQVELKHLHGLDIFLMEADFIDSLDEEKIAKEDARFERRRAWSHHVVNQ